MIRRKACKGKSRQPRNSLGCFSKRTLHIRKATINGHLAQMQERALCSLLEHIEPEMKRKGIMWYPVSTFRTCKYQKEICNRICGNSNGCPGTCAPPGRSYHQIGLAVDIYAHDTHGAFPAEYRRVMERNGWNNFSGPGGSDPNHWTYRVTG